MLNCIVGSIVPCMLICSGASMTQFEGINDRYVTMGQDNLLRLFVQIEPLKPDEESVCTDRLLAPPEPYGAVVMGDEQIDPATRELVGRVRLPMLKPRFEPALAAWSRATFSDDAEPRLPDPPAE
jgi:hypothetical protein